MVSAKQVSWRRPAFRPQTYWRRAKVFLQMAQYLLNDQRIRWFRRGIEKGDIGQCDTFAAEPL